MKRTRHTPEQIVNKLREADAMLAAGKTLAQVVANPVRRDEVRRSPPAQGTRD
jgi:hypothetical protein